MEDTGTDPKAPNFIRETSVATIKWNICFTMTMLRCTAALNFIQAEASDVFEVFHRNSRPIGTSGIYNIVPILQVAEQYLKTPKPAKATSL